MPDSPPPRNNTERLDLIQRLWRQLETASHGSKEYEALIARIRKETDLFREALHSDDDQKF